MDPNACLKELLDAIYAKDDEAVTILADNLSFWIIRDGLTPSLSPNQLALLLLYLSRLARNA